MRSFLKGDDGMAGNAITRITGSRDLYSPESRGHKASVNFMTCHDGFTLYDLYSYNEKHNEKNGWNNTDGDNNGHSWNCGAEGETDDPNVNGLRRRLIKNAFAALLCSRGPAMFLRAMSSVTPSLETTMRIVRTISSHGSTGAGLRNSRKSMISCVI